MKTKDVQSLFDSSVRKLKKHFQVETVSLDIVKCYQFPERLLAIAVCNRKIDARINLTGMTTIWPELVLKHSQGWDEDSIMLSVMATACHEVAHHLDAYRMAKQFRNLASHGNKDMFQRAKKAIHDEGLFHADGWKIIMEDEMGTPAIECWHKTTRMPKIFVR